jgi:flagellin-like hook-associated protein FlgL
MTTGMRSNLQALQQTNVLQEATMNRLATGKRVNTALDNATSFFTALSHKNRANDLLSFKDAIGESIQTIKAADTAIAGITKLIEGAKALAADAKGAVSQSATSQTLTISGITGLTAASTLDIGGTTFTAVLSATSQSVGDQKFYIGATAAELAANLAFAINTKGESMPMSATVSGAVLTIKRDSAATMVATDIDIGGATAGAVMTESVIGSGAELTAKVAKYASFITQINDMQNDAFYKGKNLLGGASSTTNDMTVRFGNNHTLAVASFDAKASGDLSLYATAGNGTGWGTETLIDADITKMDAALSTLRIKSADLSSNLAIISARDEWITSIAETLSAGADKLTLADANEEGANLLMLQTRQSISTSALSMSAQAAQSVLRLFQ